MRAVLSFLALLPVACVSAASLLETMDAEVSALYEKSKDAIIRVHAAVPPLYGLPPRKGTGFFIDDEGRFVTSATLVENTGTFWIHWRGQRLNARLIGTDPQTNLALLQADTGKSPTLSPGNADELRVGSMVVTIGYPYDLPSAPSVGFVTGLDIACGKRVFPVSFIRAGCRLRPGQGGGPMFNARGEVVGIAVAAHAEDQCYAVPMAAVKKICADMVQNGQPQYSWVGLSVTERAGQVLVQEISPNSPAADAGFQTRDVLVSICTNQIRRSADVLNTMFYRRCGDHIKMRILRAGATQEVTVVIGRRPPEPPATARMMRSLPTIVPASAEFPQ